MTWKSDLSYVWRGALVLSMPLLSLMAGGCGGASTSGASGASDTVKLAEGEIAVPYDVLQMPWMLSTDGKRLVVVNSNQAPNLVDVYSMTGDSLAGGIRVGQGPGELPDIAGICYDATTSSMQLQTNDAGVVTLLGGFADGQFWLEKAFAFDAEKCGSDTVVPSSLALRMADGRIVLGNATDDGLLAILRPDGSFEKYAASYPDISAYGDMPLWGAFNFLRPRGALSPDGKHFATVFGSNDMIGFGSLEGDSVRVKVNYGDKPGGVKWVTQNGYGTFEFTPESREYFGATPVLSDSHVYVIYHGMKRDDYYANYYWKKNDGDTPLTTTVREYDFDGRLCRIYVLPLKVSGLAVTPDDSTLYALADSETEGYRIFRFPLPR